MRLITLITLFCLFVVPVSARNSQASPEKDVYVTFTSSDHPEQEHGIYRYTRMAKYFNRPAIYFNFVNKDTGVNECLVFYDYKKEVVEDLTFYADKYMMSTTHIPVSALDKVEIIDLDKLLPTWTREQAYHYFWSLQHKRVWVIDKSHLGTDPSNPLVTQTMPGVFHEF